MKDICGMNIVWTNNEIINKRLIRCNNKMRAYNEKQYCFMDGDPLL